MRDRYSSIPTLPVPLPNVYTVVVGRGTGALTQLERIIVVQTRQGSVGQRGIDSAILVASTIPLLGLRLNGAVAVSTKQFRLEDGTLARHRPQYQSVWADDMYMSVPFLANMGVLTGDNSYFDDAVRQVLQIAGRLYIPQTALFDHGWSVTAGEYDPHFYWGRASGWTLMAMAELLDVLPEDYQERDKILHLYRSMVCSLASLQSGTGFWHNMLDKNETFLETSCTAMITFAVAKGINEGWINHVYGPVALTGWNAIKTRVLENGAVDGSCEATTFAHDNVYYHNRGASIYATHGYGPVLYAGAEIIRLLQNDTIEVQVFGRDNPVNSTFHYRLKSEWPEK